MEPSNRTRFRAVIFYIFFCLHEPFIRNEYKGMLMLPNYGEGPLFWLG